MTDTDKLLYFRILNNNSSKDNKEILLYGRQWAESATKKQKNSSDQQTDKIAEKVQDSFGSYTDGENIRNIPLPEKPFTDTELFKALQNDIADIDFLSYDDHCILTANRHIELISTILDEITHKGYKLFQEPHYMREFCSSTWHDYNAIPGKKGTYRVLLTNGNTFLTHTIKRDILFDGKWHIPYNYQILAWKERKKRNDD